MPENTDKLKCDFPTLVEKPGEVDFDPNNTSLSLKEQNIPNTLCFDMVTQKMHCTISVLLSNYNHAHFLAESLSAICNQTLPAFEIIIVDDGSTDNSVEIINNYKKIYPQITLIINEENKGPIYSINKALLKATGTYIVWASSDDILLPNFIKENFEEIRSCSYDVALVCSQLGVFQNENLTDITVYTKETHGSAFDFGEKSHYLGQEELIKRLKESFLWISGNTVVINRLELLAIGGFNEKLRWHADWFAYYMIALRRGVYVIPKLLASMRQRANTYSKTGMNNPVEQTRVLETFIEILCNDRNQDLKKIFSKCPSLFTPFNYVTILHILIKKIKYWNLFTNCIIYYVFLHQQYHKRILKKLRKQKLMLVSKIIKLNIIALNMLKYFYTNFLIPRLLSRMWALVIKTGNFSVIKFLFNLYGQKLIQDNKTILAAVKTGKLGIVKYFAERGANLNSAEVFKLTSNLQYYHISDYIQKTFAVRPRDYTDIRSQLKPLIFLYIDVFGHCNLRCPSCPVKNWSREDKSFKSSLMTKDLLCQILNKATREFTPAMVGLFNWTEPLLNPNLPELMQCVKSYNIDVIISSNLNILRNADAIMQTNPSFFRVSVSGFYQEIYQRGHQNGEIETVKKNMKILAEAKIRQNATTMLEVFFHRYIDNERDEKLMKEYAEGLGYKFNSNWAYMMPIEKVLAYADPNYTEIILTEEDSKIINRFALRMDAMLDVCSRQKLTSCTLQDDFISIDVHGDVFLCCASSNRAKNRIGNFLELPFSEIQRLKYQHSLCGPCMKRGFLVYLNHMDPAFDDIGKEARALFQKDEEYKGNTAKDSLAIAST